MLSELCEKPNEVCDQDVKKLCAYCNAFLAQIRRTAWEGKGSVGPRASLFDPLFPTLKNRSIQDPISPSVVESNI